MASPTTSNKKPTNIWEITIALGTVAILIATIKAVADAHPAAVPKDRSATEWIANSYWHLSGRIGPLAEHDIDMTMTWLGDSATGQYHYIRKSPPAPQIPIVARRYGLNQIRITVVDLPECADECFEGTIDEQRGIIEGHWKKTGTKQVLHFQVSFTPMRPTG